MDTRLSSLLSTLGCTHAPEGAAAYLEGLVSEAERAFPGLDLDALGFVRHMGTKIALCPTPAARLTELVAGSGDPLFATDLYLAYGCAIGDRRAVSYFEAQHHDTLVGVARRFAAPATSLDDLTQLLREHFLVPRGDRGPRIADYRGTGPLEGWLRVAGVRRLVDDTRRASRKERESPHEDELLERLADDGSWELGFLKARYREAFRRAFSSAVLHLSSEQRNFLRYQSVERLTLDQIGALHGMHRSSVDRRIQAARRVLLDETRRALGSVLDARPEEVDSVMRLIGSQLDASLSRLLNRGISAAPPPRSSNANST